MAVRWAVASGLWSATSTWDGLTTVPASGDTVHADGDVVTIDVSVNMGAGTLNTTQRSGGTVGGQFVLNDGVTVTAATFTAGASGAGTAGWLLSGTASATLTGNLAGGPTATSTSIGAVYSSSSGTLTINGNVPMPNTITSFMVLCSGTGNLTIVGNVGNTTAGGSQSKAVGFRSTGTLSVTGTVGAATNATVTAYGLDVTTSNPLAVTIVGAVTGAGNLCPAVVVTSNPSTFTITGAVTAGSGAQGVLISSGGSPLTITGTITSVSGQSAVESITGSLLTMTGPFVTSTQDRQMPFYAKKVALSPILNNYFEFRNTTGTHGAAVRLYSADALVDVPAPSNVRTGTVYGALTGTCAVPTAAQVVSGVAVDATTGTALLTPAAAAAAVWDYLRASAVTADSMGQRLANTATVDSTGAQLAAL